MTFIASAHPLSDIGLSGLLDSLHEVILVFPIVFLVLGILYCFFGRKLFDIFNFLIGGFIGLGIGVSVSGLSGISVLIISIIGFLIGGLIGFFTPYLFIGIVGFSIGLGLLVGLSPLLGLVGGVTLAFIAVLLFRFFLPFLTALFGGSFIAYAIHHWSGSEPASLLIGVMFVAAGTAYQYTQLAPHDRERENRGIKI